MNLIFDYDGKTNTKTPGDYYQQEEVKQELDHVVMG